MKKVFIILCSVLFLFSSFPPIISDAAGNVVEDLGDEIGTVTYSFEDNDITYNVKYTYYLYGGGDAYISYVDNSDYTEGYYTNLPNPRACNIFVKSLSPDTCVKYKYERTWTDKNGSPQEENSTGKSNFLNRMQNINGYLSFYKGNSVLQEYIKQFLSVDESYEDFVKYFENGSFYYGSVSIAANDSAVGWSSSFNIPSFYVKSGLIPKKLEADTEEETEEEIKKDISSTIYSNTDSPSNSVNAYQSLPFLYIPKGEDKPPFIEDVPVPDDNNENPPKDFICYREHKKPFISLSVHRKGSSIFTWKVEDYPEFADCFIEIRSTLLQGDSINGYKTLTDDFYYYSSVDESLKKNNQNTLLKVPFIEGTVVCEEKYMGDYFASFEEFKNIAVSCPIRMQVRVLSDDKKIYSNWVTFDFGVDGQNLWTGTMDNNGNIIDEDLSNVPGYDWDADKNPGKYDYFTDGVSSNSTGTSGFDANFTQWLDNALGSIIAFPTLLSVCYMWLPGEILTLIGIGLGMLVVLRILGR